MHTCHAPLVVPDRQVFEHALRGHLFDDRLRLALLIDDAQSRAPHDGLARGAQRAHEGHVKHAQRARRELAHDVRGGALVHGAELDRGKLVSIAREEEHVWDGVERGEQRRLFRGVAGPRVELRVVGPERGEGDRRDDEFECGRLIDLEGELWLGVGRVFSFHAPCQAIRIERSAGCRQASCVWRPRHQKDCRDGASCP